MLLQNRAVTSSLGHEEVLVSYLDHVIAATAYVLDIDAAPLREDTTFESLNADSMARVAIADAIEIMNPGLRVDNDVLLFAATLAQLSGGVREESRG